MIPTRVVGMEIELEYNPKMFHGESTRQEKELNPAQNTAPTRWLLPKFWFLTSTSISGLILITGHAKTKEKGGGSSELSGQMEK